MIFGLFGGLFGWKAKKLIKIRVGVGPDFGRIPCVLQWFLGPEPLFWGGSGAPFWGLLGAIFWQFLENLEILLFEPFFWFCDPFFLHSLCVSVSVPVSASVCVCVWVRVCTDKRGREPRRQAQGDSGGPKSGTRDQQLGTRRSSWVLLEAYANLQARWRISARPPGRGGCGRAALDLYSRFVL